MKRNETSPIICGTDFSANAKRAADVAAALAKLLGAPLRLVHASVIPSSPSTDEHLRAEAQRLQDGGAEINAEVIEGDADQVLVQVALQHSARLVVVSSLGRRVPARWLIGSVAERTAESATVPTLVVRDAAPFEAWALGERALKVFVGADFTASSDAALRWVAALRQLGPIKVIAGYVDSPMEEAGRLGVSGWHELPGSPPPLRGLLERDLRGKVSRVLGTEPVQVRGSAARGYGSRSKRRSRRRWHTSMERPQPALARFGFTRGPPACADERRVRAHAGRRANGRSAYPRVPSRACGGRSQ
jgi:nucleotide-binding universal stress UspA family protein